MASLFPWQGSSLYSLVLLGGILFGLAYWYRASRGNESMLLIYVCGIVSALIGAKTAFMLAEGWLYAEHPQRWLVWLSGKSVIGALLGGWAGVELAKKWAHYEQSTGDRFATILPFSLLLGRLGCLRAGCCRGVSCDLPWGLHRWPAVPVEMCFLLLMIGLLFLLRWRVLAVDCHFYLFLAAYGVFRFFHEFLRETPKLLAGFSGYQWQSIVMAVLAMLAWRQRHRSKQQRAQQ